MIVLAALMVMVAESIPWGTISVAVPSIAGGLMGAYAAVQAVKRDRHAAVNTDFDTTFEAQRSLAEQREEDNRRLRTENSLLRAENDRLRGQP